jgi:hypothetical protein
MQSLKGVKKGVFPHGQANSFPQLHRHMLNELHPKRDPGGPMVYRIRLKGHLGPQRTDWSEGLAITLEEDGDTLLTGPIVDQAALYGLLKKARDLGIPLVSVNCFAPGPADTSGGSK